MSISTYILVMSATKVFPRIRAVKAYTSSPVSDGDQGADCHDVDDEHWINGFPTPIANPMSGYPQYAAARKSWGINALGSLIVEVLTSLIFLGHQKL